MEGGAAVADRMVPGETPPGTAGGYAAPAAASVLAPPAAAEPGRAVLAALDLGTNNCRLLIARPARGGFRVIDAFSRIVRLGEGLTRSIRGRMAEVGGRAEITSRPGSGTEVTLWLP